MIRSSEEKTIRKWVNQVRIAFLSIYAPWLCTFIWNCSNPQWNMVGDGIYQFWRFKVKHWSCCRERKIWFRDAQRCSCVHRGSDPQKKDLFFYEKSKKCLELEPARVQTVFNVTLAIRNYFPNLEENVWHLHNMAELLTTNINTTSGERKVQEFPIYYEHIKVSGGCDAALISLSRDWREEEQENVKTR